MYIKPCLYFPSLDKDEVIHIMKNTTMQFLQLRLFEFCMWRVSGKKGEKKKKEKASFFAILITVTNIVIDSRLSVHFVLEDISKWVAWIHFGTGFDIIVKICHDNGLVFTLAHVMKSYLCCALSSAILSGDFLTKRENPTLTNFISWWTNLISGTDEFLWQKGQKN